MQMLSIRRPALRPLAMRPLAVVSLGLLAGGCSVNHYVTGKLADALSSQGTGYASDDDPELVRDAAPFGLKTMEQVLGEQPRHVGLLTSLASGFTSYTVAFVEEDGEEAEDKEPARGKLLLVRARKLFLRARDYGLRGLDVQHAGFAAATRASDPASAAERDRLLQSMKPEDVPLLYWTAAAWALAISTGKDQMKLVGQLPIVEALMARAFALDERFDDGAIHEFYVAYDGGRSAADGGGPGKAKEHLDRALALSKNEKLGGIVSYAESVSVAQQNKAEFTSLLERVIAFDVDGAPRRRLANLVAQRRARWLLSRTADLFAE